MDLASDQRDHVATVGLIAGGGRLPAEAVRVLDAQGTACVVFGFDGITDPSLGLRENRTRLGQLAALSAVLANARIDRVLIVGKFSKTDLLGPQNVISLDQEAIRLLADRGGWDDEGLLAGISSWLEAGGFEVALQDRLLRPLLAAPGPLSTRQPSESERADFEVGRGVVERLGRLGVGQCAAVRRKCVIALEAIEGTDAMIRRAGELGGSGYTVIKASRPGQDRRFDLPTVGPGTIGAMEAAGATALAIEAGSTLIVSGATFRARADDAGIAVWGFETAAPMDSTDGREPALNSELEQA